MTDYYSIKCSECPVVFQSKRPDAKTHNGACRGKRSRRLKKGKRMGTVVHTPEQREVNAIVRGDVRDIARPMLEEELRPVVREAINEDTFRAIRDMVALTPQAVDALADDLQSDNAALRQRAAKLVLQYTVGHPAIVRPDDADPQQQLVVNFALPRPGSPEHEATAVELRDCAACGASKPEDQFVGNSNRCNDCHAKLLEHAAPFLRQQASDSTDE